ncbi:MAG: hypothetical protein H0V89_11430 [Deltaproteobacteria bacterium]|nr:hypothetical protein [Deltaproteobacteria bacterium]
MIHLTRLAHRLGKHLRAGSARGAAPFTPAPPRSRPERCHPDVLAIGDVDRDGADDLLITIDLASDVDPLFYSDVVPGRVGFGF